MSVLYSESETAREYNLGRFNSKLSLAVGLCREQQNRHRPIRGLPEIVAYRSPG